MVINNIKLKLKGHLRRNMRIEFLKMEQLANKVQLQKGLKIGTV